MSSKGAVARKRSRTRSDLEVVLEEIEARQRVRSKWREALSSISVLYRAPDGALLGIPKLSARKTPKDLIEMTGAPLVQRGVTEEDWVPPYRYPKAWVQLEDRHRTTGWLRDLEQRLDTAEYIEAWRPSVPQNPGEFVEWDLLGRGPRPTGGVRTELVRLPDVITSRVLARYSRVKLAELWTGKPGQKQVLSNVLGGRDEVWDSDREEIEKKMAGRSLGDLGLVVAEVLDHG